MSYIEQTFSLKKKISIVTGSFRGNGKEIALALGKSGSELILVDQNEKLANFNEKLISQGIKSTYYLCDLSNLDETKKIFNQIINKHRTIDILVNNAGITRSNNFENYSRNDWIDTFNVNLFSIFLITQCVSYAMKKKRKGSIINITSLNAEVAFPDNPAYMASKGGLKQLTKSTALDLGKLNIRCNNVGPGYMKTNMTLKSWNNKKRRIQIEKNTILERWGKSHDLVGLIIFLASDASSYITGQDFYVDGGWLTKGLK